MAVQQLCLQTKPRTAQTGQPICLVPLLIVDASHEKAKKRFLSKGLARHVRFKLNCVFPICEGVIISAWQIVWRGLGCVQITLVGKRQERSLMCFGSRC
eukprot:5514349-Amphidinium_carterae.1